jgi:hypothetical protein
MKTNVPEIIREGGPKVRCNPCTLCMEDSNGDGLFLQGLNVKDIANTAGTSSERLGACQDGAHLTPRLRFVYVQGNS